MRETRVSAAGLREAIEHSGYYPDLVADAVESALGKEPVVAYVVHHEATFDPAMEVRRHVTVLVLSPTRLLVCHTDEHPPAEGVPTPHASTTTEAVPLSRIQSVAVTRLVPDPAAYVPGRPAHGGDADDRLGRHLPRRPGAGHLRRRELRGRPRLHRRHHRRRPLLRVSEAADGPEAVAQVLTFAKALSEATAPAVP